MIASPVSDIGLMKKPANNLSPSIAASFIGLLLLLAVSFLLEAVSARASDRFEKSYRAKEHSHLTISNVKGNISVSSWSRKTISVRALTDPSVSISDKKSDDDIEIEVKNSLNSRRADFEVSVPPETSVSITNIIGRIEVRGIKGHIEVESIEGDVRLLGVRGRAVDVRVTNGNIYFDGQLEDEGDYSFLSMNGDIDVRLPASSSFRLKARALKENINLGDFLSDFINLNRDSKEITGSHRDDGPKLTLTTYRGRILFHKK
jgi:DUF4097 and DUF4098 domain-containing protein YvlB